MVRTPPPEVDEYAESFAGYVELVAKDEDIAVVLTSQLREVLTWLNRIPEARGDYRYASRKWSLKEVVGHLSDTERVFAYRALRIGRGDTTSLPGFDDQAYVPELRAADRSLADMTAEWGDVRRATITLLRNLPIAAWQRRGTASDQSITVRALAYVIAGHTRHHLEVLKTRYAE